MPLAFPTRVFAQGLARLHAAGYRTGSLLEGVAYLRQGNPVPPWTLVLTFDDGYRSVYEEALPVLQRYGMTATVFLTVGPRGPRTPAARLRALTGPYGRAAARTRALVREHFACACSDQLGLVAPRSDPYALERIDAYYLRTERLFALLLTRVFPWYLMARSIPRRLRRAVSLGVLRPR